MVTERLLEASSVVLRTQDAVRIGRCKCPVWNPLGIEGLCSTHLFLSTEVEHEENIDC